MTVDGVVGRVAQLLSEPIGALEPGAVTLLLRFSCSEAGDRQTRAAAVDRAGRALTLQFAGGGRRRALAERVAGALRRLGGHHKGGAGWDLEAKIEAARWLRAAAEQQSAGGLRAEERSSWRAQAEALLHQSAEEPLLVAILSQGMVRLGAAPPPALAAWMRTLAAHPPGSGWGRGMDPASAAESQGELVQAALDAHRQTAEARWLEAALEGSRALRRGALALESPSHPAALTALLRVDLLHPVGRSAAEAAALRNRASTLDPARTAGAEDVGAALWASSPGPVVAITGFSPVGSDGALHAVAARWTGLHRTVVCLAPGESALGARLGVFEGRASDRPVAWVCREGACELPTVDPVRLSRILERSS